VTRGGADDDDDDAAAAAATAVVAAAVDVNDVSPSAAIDEEEEGEAFDGNDVATDSVFFDCLSLDVAVEEEVIPEANVPDAAFVALRFLDAFPTVASITASSLGAGEGDSGSNFKEE